MVRRKIDGIREWVETRLRCLCSRISPDARVWVIVAMFLFFAALSLRFTASSIYRFGRGDGERVQIEHIERLELELRQRESRLDSVKQQLNDYYYDNGKTE